MATSSHAGSSLCGASKACLYDQHDFNSLLATKVGLGGLLLAMFLILWLVLHGQARHLREYASRLLSVGLDQRWSRRVLINASVGVTFTGVGVGLLTGLGVIGVFAKYATQGWYSLTIPYQYLAFVVVAVLLFAALSIHLGLWSLRVETLRTH